jgi:hypothetical protein
MRLHFFRLPGWLLAVVLVCGTAQAQEPVHEVSLGLSAFSYNSYFRTSLGFQNMVDLGYRRPLGRDGLLRRVQVGGGLRTGLSEPSADVRFPLEAYGLMHVAARIGVWEATLGAEVGVSGFARLFRPRIPAEDESILEYSRLSPVYLALGAAPLRFRYERAVVSLLEFHIGSSSWFQGHAVRLHLGLLRVGFTL